MDEAAFKALLAKATDFNENPFHPFVWILGEPEFGKNIYIGGFSEINAKNCSIKIGDNCDIASFVSINCADSHKLTIGRSEKVDRQPIVLEHNVFVGSHSVIKGGATIGHHTVVAAGTIVDGVCIPPYSLAAGNPMVVKPGYYESQS